MKRFGNVRDVFKTLKHRKPSRIYCPQCASQKITLSSSLDSWLTPRKYICQTCGYVGSIIMEIEKEEEEKGSD